jgi:radical SAM superfamily enzyme YgiQ (UPF0313 family)
MKADGPKGLTYLPFPFFLAQATALLEREGAAEVLAIDAIAEGLTEGEYDAKVASFAPDLILAETATASFSHDARHAQRAKTLLPGVRLAWAGPHATSHPDRALADNACVDWCLVGEYEWTLAELVRQLAKGSLDPGTVAGLAWRGADGRVVVNPRRALGDVGDLPWPSWGHFPMLRYRDPFCGIPEPMVNMLASRGCPYRCDFCLWPETMYGGHAYRVREAGDVADEMEAAVGRYGFRTVYFDDDTFNLGKKRVLALAEAIRARDLGVNLAVMARADGMDEETLDALRGAGLYAVKYGIESGSQAVVDGCGKGLDLATARRMVEYTQRIGVKVHLTFTLGLKGETAESMRLTRELALALDPDSLQLSFATPFPGTRFHAWARERGYLSATDHELFDGGQGCVVRTEALSAAEIEEGAEAFRAAWKARLAERQGQAATAPATGPAGGEPR